MVTKKERKNGQPGNVLPKPTEVQTATMTQGSLRMVAEADGNGKNEHAAEDVKMAACCTDAFNVCYLLDFILVLLPTTTVALLS